MKENCRLTILIPCFNEEKHIAAMALELEKFAAVWHDSFAVILINDGSTDKTVAEIEKNRFLKFLQTQNCFKAIHLTENVGKGAALKAGVAATESDFLLTLDADMAASPLELLHWKNLKGEFSTEEILIASREHEQAEVQDNVVRRFVGRIFNKLVRTVTQLDVKDSQCGFKLYPTAIAKTLFSALQTKGWAHDVELLWLAKKHQFKVTELPVTWQIKPDSKINVLTDSVKMFADILKIRRRLKS